MIRPNFLHRHQRKHFLNIGAAAAGRIMVYPAPLEFSSKIVAMCASAIEFFEYQSPHFAATP